MTAALGIILLLLVIMTEKKQSVRELSALVFNALILFGAMVLIIYQLEPLAVCWIALTAVSAVTLFYQNGFNKKTQAAFISIIIIVLLLSFPLWFICSRAGLYGLNVHMKGEDEIAILDVHLHVDFLRVAYMMVMMGILGSVKDSAMAVATGTYEIFCEAPDSTFRDLMSAALDIGRNILGVTVNTLLFAAAGESVLLFYMYAMHHYSLAELINSKSFLQETVLLFMGGIGIELSVPVTACVLAWLCNNKDRSFA